MWETRNRYKILIGKLKERNHSKDLGQDGSIILKLTLGKQFVDEDCIQMAQGRYQWQRLEITVMNLWVTQKVWNWTS